MKIKYNRLSTQQQTGERFKVDNQSYDKVLLDKVSGRVPFKEREGGKQIQHYVEKGLLKTLVVEELSRLGRNTGDCIQTLEWLEENEVNVVIRNLGLESRPGGEKNPVWKMITAIMGSIYELEVSNIAERTQQGRFMYLQRGGKLGRPDGTTENKHKFLSKPKSVQIQKYLEKGMTVREVAKVVECSTSTVMKVKKMVA